MVEKMNACWRLIGHCKCAIDHNDCTCIGATAKDLCYYYIDGNTNVETIIPAGRFVAE